MAGRELPRGEALRLPVQHSLTSVHVEARVEALGVAVRRFRTCNGREVLFFLSQWFSAGSESGLRFSSKGLVRISSRHWPRDMQGGRLRLESISDDTSPTF